MVFRPKLNSLRGFAGTQKILKRGQVNGPMVQYTGRVERGRKESARAYGLTVSVTWEGKRGDARLPICDLQDVLLPQLRSKTSVIASRVWGPSPDQPKALNRISEFANCERTREPGSPKLGTGRIADIE
jgi:hypothetical protein